MVTELKIINLAFRPLSDEGEEEVDLDDDALAGGDLPDGEEVEEDEEEVNN